MNKNEFLQKLVDLYEDFTEENTKTRIEAYLVVLSENINYNKLWQILIKNYDNFRYAPSPAYINKLIEKMPKYGEGLF